MEELDRRIREQKAVQMSQTVEKARSGSREKNFTSQQQTSPAVAVSLKNQNTVGKPASKPVVINERIPTEEDGFEDEWLSGTLIWVIINKYVVDHWYKNSKCAC